MPSARSALPAWQKLTEHQRAQSRLHLRELFARDPGRFRTFSLALDGMLLDYSKQRVTVETMRLLAQLARECELEAWRMQMLTGKRVNASEDRAALHVALRAAAPVRVEGQDATREVTAVLADMRRFARGVRSGRTRGASGRAFTDVLKHHDIAISMDGKGRWVDNVFVERLWKSVKYEHVYLHAYDSVAEAKQQLASYFEFYNTRRPHSSLGGQTPHTAYCGNGVWLQAA